MSARPYPRCKCPDARETVPLGSITCQRCGRSLFPGDAEAYASRVMYCVNSAMLEQSLDLFRKMNYSVSLRSECTSFGLVESEVMQLQVQRPDGTDSKTVNVLGFNRLTPRAARAALQIAYGETQDSGTVCGESYGYKVYAESARKIKEKADG